MKCLTWYGWITNGNCGCSTGTQGAASVNIDIMLRDRDAEIARLKAEVTERDAACAEMRAALAALLPLAFPLDGGSDGCGTVGGWKADLLNDTRALLERSDLGAGKVLVEREDIDEWRDLITDLVFDLDAHSRAKKAVADLDALLGDKKGGG